MLPINSEVKQDRFIILEDQEYIVPNNHGLIHYKNPLQGDSLFNRIRVLNEMLN